MASLLDPIGQRLALSASDIKSLTGWPDPMVEDYLELLRSLYESITTINQMIVDNLNIEIKKNPATTVDIPDNVGYTRIFIEDDLLKGRDIDGNIYPYSNEVFLGAPTAYPAHPALVFNQVTIGAETVYQMQVSDGTP